VTPRFRSVWPFQHLGLKVLSVGIALLLWMIVAGEQVVERGLRVPLELQQFPAGLELQAEPPSFVDVRVRGGSGILARLAPSEMFAVVDLRTARPGRRLFPLTAEDVRVPFGVEVVQITPPGIALVFEKSVTRQLPVVPAIDGDPAPGYVRGTVTVDPAAVEVTGPESAVTEAEGALTEAVSIAGASAAVTEQVSIGFEHPALRLKVPRQARVSVQVLPGPRERAVRNVAVRLENMSAALSAEAHPSTVDLVLRGTREAVGRVDPGTVTAFVDLAGLGAGEYTLPVRAEASPDVGAARIDPPNVQVRIVRAKE
jgi:YbbR domain-containing protein